MEKEEEVSPGIRTAETMMRVVPVGLSVTALVLMLKNSQSNDFGSLSYTNLGAFRYLVHANGICAGYSLISAAVSAMPRSSSTMPRAWTFFLLDHLLTYIILAAGVISSEVLFLAYKGDASITWSEACSSFEGFCNKATASVIISFAVVVFYVLLSQLSSYRLFSRFNAPTAEPDKAVETAVFRH